MKLVAAGLAAAGLVAAGLAARTEHARRAFGRKRLTGVTLDNRYALAVSAALIVASQSGCASLAPAPAPADQVSSNSAAVTRQRIGAIDIGGRLSVRYQKDGHEEAVHGSFTWSQRLGHTLITLLSPLGQTLATIELTPGQATLTQTGQPVRREPDADALAQNALGWPLPVAGLGDWLQGFTVDGAGHALALSPADTATIRTRDGWQLLYPSWDGERHPRRIDLARNTSEAGDVAIRIVIDSWQPQ